MMVIEEEFERGLEHLRQDATAAARFGFAELAIHVLASRRPEMFDRLQEHAGFWNMLLAGLQGSAFVALGRLFDRRRDAYSAEKVLRCAVANTGLFRKTALKERRQRDDPTFDEANFPAFFAAVHEADRASFDQANAALERWAEFFKTNVEDIRHFFAHTKGRSREQIDAMFAELFARQYEQLLVFPLRLHDALRGLYANGAAPVLRAAPTRIHDVIDAAASGPSTNTWVHVQAVREVIGFADSLTDAPSPNLAARERRGASG